MESKEITKEELISSYLSVLMKNYVKDNSRVWARVLIGEVKAQETVADKKINMTMKVSLSKEAIDFLESVVYEKESAAVLKKQIQDSSEN